VRTTNDERGEKGREGKGRFSGFANREKFPGYAIAKKSFYSINQSIYLFQTTRIHSKQRTDDKKVTEYTNETDRNTVTRV